MMCFSLWLQRESNVTTENMATGSREMTRDMASSNPQRSAPNDTSITRPCFIKILKPPSSAALAPHHVFKHRRLWGTFTTNMETQA